MTPPLKVDIRAEGILSFTQDCPAHSMMTYFERNSLRTAAMFNYHEDAL
jgi:hypothetical protein